MCGKKDCVKVVLVCVERLCEGHIGMCRKIVGRSYWYVRKDCVKAVLVCAERLCEGRMGMCGKIV